MRHEFDLIVVGAGAGGLASALMAQQQGKSVLVLEAHSTVGGCAGYFKRGPFCFDVGATTVGYGEKSGLLDHFFQNIGFHPKLKHIDPGIIFHYRGREIKRWRDHQRWSQELSDRGQIQNSHETWMKLEKLSSSFFKILPEIKSLWPQKFSDFPSIDAWWDIIKLAPSLFIPTSLWMRVHGGYSHDFKVILNHLSLVSAQAFLDQVPLAIGALALNYPTQTYYPMGGMGGLMEDLSQHFIQGGGKLHLRERMQAYRRDDHLWLVKTHRDEYKTKKLVLNQTIWQTQPETKLNGWGAFCVYFAVRLEKPVHSLYQQIITHEHESYFVSFSDPDDERRAPSGWQVVTISTHVQVEDWQKSDIDYEKKKTEKMLTVKKIFTEIFSAYGIMEFKFVEAGTPASFEHYTLRPLGRVGGLPHRLNFPFFRWPHLSLGEPELYRVGDTIFPGQGLVGAVQGAKFLFQKIR